MKKIRKADAPIADKLRKRLGRPAKGTDAPVDLEARKFKKRLLLIGIPVTVALLAGTAWLIISNRPPPAPPIPDSHIFSSPLPQDSPVEPLQNWLPNRAVEQFIWGDYIVELPENIEYTQLADGASLMGVDLNGLLRSLEMEFEEAYTEQHEGDFVSVLPLRITAGPRNINHRYVADFAKEGYGFISYGVYSERNQSISYIGLPYKVESNKIIIYTEWWHSGDSNAEVEVYTDSTIVLSFYFEGFYLVLERGGLTVRMIPRQFVDDDSWINSSFQASGNQEFEDILSIEHIASPFLPDGTVRAGDGSFISHSDNPETRLAVKIDLYEEGIMRISQNGVSEDLEAVESDEAALWVRYIWCGNDGLILVDENGQYYLYQEPRRNLNNFDVGDSEEPDEVLTLLERLELALTEAGIPHEIDTIRGTVSASAGSDVLFEINSYELSDSGKEYIKRYLDVLAELVKSDEYTGSSAEILIEGHACSRGTRAANQRLSERRAAAVKSFTELEHPELAEIMETIGMASSSPILDENGNEDRDASRRIVFLFTLKTPVA